MHFQKLQDWPNTTNSLIFKAIKKHEKKSFTDEEDEKEVMTRA